MNDEIKAILEKLKDNIPIEEYRSEGTSDGLTHYEEDKDSWQYKLLDYITNLRTIEQQYSAILSENAELENKLTNLQEENERLKELCDKYEEEHDNEFKKWQKDIKANKKAIRTLETLKGSARWERHLYEVDELLKILGGEE